MCRNKLFRSEILISIYTLFKMGESIFQFGFKAFSCLWIDHLSFDTKHNIYAYMKRFWHLTPPPPNHKNQLVPLNSDWFSLFREKDVKYLRTFSSGFVCIFMNLPIEIYQGDPILSETAYSLEWGQAWDLEGNHRQGPCHRFQRAWSASWLQPNLEDILLSG